MLLRYQGRSADLNPESFRLSLRDGGPGHVCPVPPTAQSSPRRLDRLALNVANLCNLDCAYCYAQGGGYGGPRRLMSAATGRKALDRFFRQYDEIGVIQFFGGEPLINWRTIDRIAEYGWRCAERLGRPRPRYSLVSNGTVMSPRIVDLIHRWQIEVTVSLDGPPEIHDRLRRRLGGGGSSQLIVDNVRLLREETGQPNQIEGTYTRLHVEHGVSVVDLLSYVRDVLGVPQLHLPMNVLGTATGAETWSLGPKHVEWCRRAYADAVAMTLRQLVERPCNQICILRSARQILEALVDGAPCQRLFVCPAGSGTLAVDWDGRLYPCFMFYGCEPQRIGCIHSDGALVEEEARQTFLSSIRFTGDDAASASWAAPLVRGCAAGNWWSCGEAGRIPLHEVGVVEDMVSAAAVELSALARDPERWDTLRCALQIFRLYLAAPVESPAREDARERPSPPGRRPAAAD